MTSTPDMPDIPDNGVFEAGNNPPRTTVEQTPTGDTVYTPPRLVPRTTKVALYQGDDEAKLAELEEKALRLRMADDSTKHTLDEGETWRDAVNAYNTLVDEAESRAVVVTLRALGRKAWREMVRDHPAREGNKEDETIEVNTETFPEALLLDSITSPAMPQEALIEFLDGLSDAQFDRIWVAAFQLNRTVAPTPKALNFSAPTQSGDAT